MHKPISEQNSPPVMGRSRIPAGGRGLWRGNWRFLVLLGCIVFFKGAVADLSSISGGSMLPTLVDGDKIWVNKLAYDVRIPFTDVLLARRGEPRRGDIVIIDSGKAGKRLVKRIVGLPGDTIAMQDNSLLINGVEADYEILSREGDAVIILEGLPETRSNHRARLVRGVAARSYGPVIVPADGYYVLGDNRDNSADSRVYSFIPRREIIGRSRAVVFSLDRENHYLPRNGRFFSRLD